MLNAAAYEISYQQYVKHKPAFADVPVGMIPGKAGVTFIATADQYLAIEPHLRRTVTDMDTKQVTVVDPTCPGCAT